MSFSERTLKTEAIVLRRSDFSEADYLVTLYTLTQGKIRAIAKGARKATSRTTGQVELYARVHLVLSRGRELHIITQAEATPDHAIFQAEFERGLYASHFVELVDQVTYEDEENQAAYRLLVAALGWIAQPETNLRLAARYFEFRLMRVMGYEPSLFRCAVGEEALAAENQFFSPADGGVVCEAHGGGRGLLPLALPVFKVLRHFSRNPWEAVSALHPTEETLGALERILQAYWVFCWSAASKVRIFCGTSRGRMHEYHPDGHPQREWAALCAHRGLHPERRSAR
ncbi:MAG: DNA repair protein RecO [Anaerolineae bacterium]|nr:DNA repair protein RecO [Anaerolineae bacterium]